MVVRIINKSSNLLPSYETLLSAGMDIRAFLDQPLIIKPLERALIKTGLYIELPKSYEAQVRSRSGLALKKGITVLNSPGTIDADYRGEIGVILINLSNEKFNISTGDRIAQLVVSKHERVDWELSKSLDQTNRGDRGFGSTGSN
ncbi:MAG: dUTP diphosphatase [Flavobacteriaceae bacterium]|jgi:dUTP pyrophosphatase|nr:dUTP diphosphatase [Flavobacteriaceae bacterium]MBT3753912.1 dUTP diphosphatase [Flavobacteriaceae bacterium]MBT3794585.1 dUTP diphosphatase [Flavobacteriaceae bacterium]MBT4062505.1 dUTP diphosphatase [Flavobacteriaceae bacterium]MBT4414963.1 dUTP diphosphatase [Flavobacteriaceae bacterium]